MSFQNRPNSADGLDMQFLSPNSVEKWPSETFRDKYAMHNSPRSNSSTENRDREFDSILVTCNAWALSHSSEKLISRHLFEALG